MSDILSQIEEIQGNVRDIKATWGNTIMTLDNIKSSLKADRQKAIDEAYQKGFEAGQHEATTLEYQQGLDDAWKAITKIAKMPDGERMTHFGEVWISNILNVYSLEQIFTILEKSESEPDKIEVGDEVAPINALSRPFVVVSVKDNVIYGFDLNGGCTSRGYSLHETHLKKTGRHFPQVAELLEAMKGGAE